MFYQIIIHTPVWVWALLSLLLWVGIKQTQPGQPSLLRITVVPLVLTSLSLYGTVSAFGSAPVVMLTWLAAAIVLATVVLQRPLPEVTRFDAHTRTFRVPGSWVPLALMVGIFANKYVVGVALNMHPELTREATFTLGFSALSGAFSGVFAARAVRLWRLALVRTLDNLLNQGALS
ncbi:MAG TPA: hypothetical protein PK497_11035 [Burkholderiaceae bacterium]|jgi:hypothetical protein|nr:hypothetical protein [Burkholderiaceae bacterium]HPH14606.1 hypothetical protein [Burkholderiaceae bacterium]